MFARTVHKSTKGSTASTKHLTKGRSYHKELNIELNCKRRSSVLKVGVQAELALLLGVHHAHLLVLAHPLLKEVGLAFQGDILHEVEGVFNVVYLKYVIRITLEVTAISMMLLPSHSSTPSTTCLQRT